jgi:hypothetical protein
MLRGVMRIHRHIGFAAIVAATVGTTLLLTGTALAAQPFFRDAMYYLVPFTVPIIGSGRLAMDAALRKRFCGALAALHGIASTVASYEGRLMFVKRRPDMRELRRQLGIDQRFAVHTCIKQTAASGSSPPTAPCAQS